MKNRAHTWHSKIQFKVTFIVPGERCHAVTASDAKLFQCVGKPRHSFGHLPIRDSLKAWPSFSDNFLFRKDPPCSLQQWSERKPVVNHLSLHGTPPLANTNLKSSLRR